MRHQSVIAGILLALVAPLAQADLQYAQGVQVWAAADAATTVYTISGLPFQPEAIEVFNLGSGSASDSSADGADAYYIRGFASSASSRRCVSAISDDGAGTGNPASIVMDNAIACSVSPVAAVDGQLDFGGFTSDGFTFVVDDATPVNKAIGWRVWGESAGSLSVTIGDITEPASTGNVDYSATNFVAAAEDQVVMFAGVGSTAALNTGFDDDHGFYVGDATGASGEQYVCAQNTDSGSVTIDTDHYCLSGEAIAVMVIAGGNPDARASLTQFGTGNFRLNWTARAVTGRRSAYMAIKGGKWQAGDLTINGNSAASTATVSGLAFTPIGITTVGAMTTEQTAGTSVVHSRLSMGGGTSTSSRFAMTNFDEDALADSDTSVMLQADQVLTFLSAAFAETTSYDINAMNSDGFQLITDLAGGVASEWIGYLTFGDTVASAPVFSVGPTESPITNGFQISGTLTGTGTLTAYAVWCNPGDAAPNATELIAGQCGGGNAAIVAANEVWTTGVSNNFNLSAANKPVRADVYVAASNGTPTAVTSLTDQDRSTDSGQETAVMASHSSTGVCNEDAEFDPDCADGDVFEYDALTNEDADCEVNFEADGDFELVDTNAGNAPLDDCADLRTFEISFQDVSSATTGLFTAPATGNFTTDYTIPTNNSAPVCDPFDDPVVLEEDVAMGTIDLTLKCADPDGHAIAFTVTTGVLPTGTALGGTGNKDWTGTPTTENEAGSTDIVTAVDPFGASHTLTILNYVVDTWTVPNCVGDTPEECEAEIIAVAPWRDDGEGAGLVLGDLVCNEIVPEGEIVAQDPAASSEAGAVDDITVDLAVSCASAGSGASIQLHKRRGGMRIIP